MVDGGRERRMVAEWLRGGGEEGRRGWKIGASFTEGEEGKERVLCSPPRDHGRAGRKGGGGWRRAKGGERRATAFARREGKAGRMGRREERGRRKVAVDGESKAENPKGNHSTRDIVGRVVVSTPAGKENQSLSLSAVGFFSGVSLRDFSEGKLKGNGRKLFLLASDFWHVSGRGMFFLGNLGGRV